MSTLKVYSTQELAVILGVHDSLIRKWIKKGKAYPALRLGKHGYVFERKELDRLKRLRKRQAKSPVKRLITKPRSAL